MFNAFKDVFEVPVGLDQQMCLIIDSASLASIDNPKTIPFITAVDVNFDWDYDPHDEQFDHVCKGGHFKVAISSLMPDLFPSLASGGFTSAMLQPYANPVFTTAYGL